jgi:hypothetical protein
MMRTRIAVLLVLSSFHSTTHAQEPDPASAARFRAGPFAVTPTLVLRFAGIDANVFNEVDAPQRDFTVVLGPEVQGWLRLGRARLTMRSQLDYVYFREFETERSFNTSHDARIELPLGRLRPFVEGRFANTRDRQGFEIDARLRRMENALTAGVDLRLGGRITPGIAVYRTNSGYDRDAVLSGTYLYEILDQKSYGLRFTVRRALTPFTTVLVAGDVQRDRFEFAPRRDANIVRVTSGVEFSAFALIAGTANVGFRNYDSQNTGQPSHRGVVAAVDLAHTIRGTTRVAVHLEHDLSYSFEQEAQYYLLTGLTLTAIQRITSRWDFRLNGGRHRLDYLWADVSRPVDNARGVDRVHSYGAGIGYHVGSSTRIGLNVDYSHSRSGARLRLYEGIRAGTSMSYGF